MTEKTKMQKMIEFVEGNPGKTAPEIAKAVGISDSSAASNLIYLFRKDAVTRVDLSKTRTPKYAYTFNPSPNPAKVRAPARPKKEQVQTDTVSVCRGPLEVVVDALAQAVAERFFEKLKGALIVKAMDLMPTTQFKPVAEAPAAPNMAPEPKEPPLTTKRTVGVVGLLPTQNAEIKARFGDTFNLIFAGCGEFGRLQSLGRSCDKVFLHVKHVGHSTESSLLGGGADIVRVNGGVTQMKEMLKRYWDTVSNEGEKK